MTYLERVGWFAVTILLWNLKLTGKSKDHFSNISTGCQYSSREITENGNEKITRLFLEVSSAFVRNFVTEMDMNKFIWR